MPVTVDPSLILPLFLLLASVWLEWSLHVLNEDGLQ